MEPCVPGWLAEAFPQWSWKSLRRCCIRVDPELGAGLDLETSEYGYLVEATSSPSQAQELHAGVVIIAIAGTPLLGIEESSLEASFGAHFRDGAELILADVQELQRASAAVQTDAGYAASVGVAMEDMTAVETVEVDGFVMQSLPARNRRKRRGGDTEESRASRAAPGVREVARGTTDVATIRGKPPPTLDDFAGVTSLESALPGEVRQFEYMDHTADVILHSWGSSLEESFAQVCVCFFSYMTDLNTVDPRDVVEVEASGHDVLDLLYHLLDEFLFSFGTEFIVCRYVDITELDLCDLKVRARGCGERFDLKKHPQGTEIKAITMHQMKILTPETLTTEEGEIPRKQSAMEGGGAKEGFPFECFVLVDI